MYSAALLGGEGGGGCFVHRYWALEFTTTTSKGGYAVNPRAVYCWTVTLVVCLKLLHSYYFSHADSLDNPCLLSLHTLKK